MPKRQLSNETRLEVIDLGDAEIDWMEEKRRN